MGTPDSVETRRMSAIAAACSSCVPCEKLSRATLSPASTSARKVAGARDAGPIVATILVRFDPRCSIKQRIEFDEVLGEPLRERCIRACEPEPK
jgi:hypothetical protein